MNKINCTEMCTSYTDLVIEIRDGCDMHHERKEQY